MNSGTMRFQPNMIESIQDSRNRPNVNFSAVKQNVLLAENRWNKHIRSRKASNSISQEENYTQMKTTTAYLISSPPWNHPTINEYSELMYQYSVLLKWCGVWGGHGRIGPDMLRSLLGSLLLYMSSSFAKFSRHHMSRISQLTTGNGGLAFTPAVGKHSATVILMHGLGDSAEGLQDVPEIWQGSKLGHIKFILPTAPMRPVTLNLGHRMNAWYDIAQLDDRTHDPNEGIAESSAYIRSLIETEIEKTGLPLSRIALAGFSQGGAMSLFTGLQDAYLPSPDTVNESNRRLAGVLVLSGYLPNQQAFVLSQTKKDTEVFHCHGAVDPVVKLSWAQKSQEGLKEMGLSNYELKVFPRVEHSISMDILKDAETFLEKILPASSEYVVKPRDPRNLSIKELKEAIRDSGLNSKAVGLSEKSEYVNLVLDYYNSKGITFQ